MGVEQHVAQPLGHPHDVVGVIGQQRVGGGVSAHGAQGARTEIAAIKVAAPRVCLDVLDRAIQLHGGAGVSDDTPLASFWAHARTLRIVDGPDAVHLRSVAREELERERPYRG